MNVKRLVELHGMLLLSEDSFLSFQRHLAAFCKRQKIFSQFFTVELRSTRWATTVMTFKPTKRFLKVLRATETLKREHSRVRPTATKGI